ncbi:peptidoglycan-binding domain-containing protein [Nocardia barduliensis]|uniref:peptidoglycan-binding domain-containing protein n=1 Tax=Nocardia barduliensis TaxID=2736643 RepID=UPI001573E52D|nr:peptidoglycan-binding protein [Nocardia barduliensis]
MTESSVFVPLSEAQPFAPVVWPVRDDVFAEEALGEFGAVGPCRDVTVAPTDRPPVLRQGAVHPSIREVQRKLNAFHRHRVDNGESGLPHAPLVLDCVYGTRTRDAVRAFQVVSLPGQLKEHDGRVGKNTWLPLDSIAVGSAGVAEVTVETCRFTDASGRAIDWDHIIGLHGTTVDVEISASGLPAAAMPVAVVAQIAAHPPNLVTSPGGAPIRVDVPKTGADPTKPSRIRYRSSQPLRELAPLLLGGDLSVAIVGRRGATSDGEFRRNLDALHRGAATQPLSAGSRTADEFREAPDAFDLFRAGGVQVLEVRVAPRPHWRAPAGQRRLGRSPARFFYYSGHGLSSSGMLAIDTQGKQCGQGGSTFDNWLGPAEILPLWTVGVSPDVLIIAGCSMLKINLGEHLFLKKPLVGPGLAWSQLLANRQGGLTALLGYGGRAPCDKPNGDRIAAAMARRIRSGSTAFAWDWLTVNGDNNADNAAAIDVQGFWWIESKTLGGYQIRGPLKLP